MVRQHSNEAITMGEGSPHLPDAAARLKKFEARVGRFLPMGRVAGCNAQLPTGVLLIVRSCLLGGSKKPSDSSLELTASSCGVVSLLPNSVRTYPLDLRGRYAGMFYPCYPVLMQHR